MKLLILCCFLPAILCAPSKRFLLDSLGSIFDITALRCDVQLILDAVGGDPTEAACESECHVVLQEGHILNYGCPLVCHAIQNIAHYFHIVPDTSGPTDACGAPITTVAHGHTTVVTQQ